MFKSRIHITLVIALLLAGAVRLPAQTVPAKSDEGKLIAVLRSDASRKEKVDACRGLARDLVDRHAIPQEAVEDAVHIAIAAVHGVDYLLTWNYARIANAQRRDAIEQVCRDNGCEPPLICTPEELLGEQ